ncbi:MAG: PRC-barrel domain-containing protein [Candidatus Bathyarchaeia archaeon]
MAKQEKAVTKDMLVGMQVIDAEGRIVGTVKDVSFIVGKTGISLYVEGKKGESRNIPWDEVQAVGDFILLKPEQAQTQPTCPICKGPLTYIPQYQRWYCYACKKYA